MKGRVLTIAGSDPSGGAGIQADIKTVTALGGYASAAITALTVQNTLGVSKITQMTAAFIGEQINAVLSDIGADAIKIGMIGDAPAATAIGEALAANAGSQKLPIVLDPVLVATSGDALASGDLAAHLQDVLVPQAALLTPNAEEATKLTGVVINGPEDQRAAGEALVQRGAGAALVKGGHLESEILTDVLVTPSSVRVFSHPRIDTRSTHGTGCTLASAIATGLAQGLALQAAVKRGIDYTQEAIRTAPGLGGGAGPLNHARPFSRSADG